MASTSKLQEVSTRSSPAACDSRSDRAARGSSSNRATARSTRGGDLGVEGEAGVLGEPGAVRRLGADGAIEPPGGDGGARRQHGAGVGRRPPVVEPGVDLGPELGRVLAGEDELLGAEAVLQPVVAGPVGPARSGALLRILAVGLDLLAARHRRPLSLSVCVVAGLAPSRRGRRAAHAPRER